MLIWEISSGQQPFAQFDHDYNLALKIINGIRPKIVSGTPLEYENLMKQCWDADPSKRTKGGTLVDEIIRINRLYSNEKKQQQINNMIQLNANINTSSSSINSLARKFSKIHIFENLPNQEMLLKVNY